MPHGAGSFKHTWECTEVYAACLLLLSFHKGSARHTYSFLLPN